MMNFCASQASYAFARYVRTICDCDTYLYSCTFVQVRGPIAASFGLGISLQERLMTLPLYGQTSTISPYPLTQSGQHDQQQQQQQQEQQQPQKQQQQQQRDTVLSNRISTERGGDAAITEVQVMQSKDCLLRNSLPYTQLTSNYSSHRVLLEVPSRLFYGGSLIEKGDRALVDSLCNWEGLPQTTAYTAASTTDASAVSASDDMIACV